MTERKTYWIQDVDGVKACVDGADTRDLWTRVHGWTETDEPTGQQFQWVRNANHGGRGVLNHAAVLLHEGLGWFPSDPPPPPGYPETPVEEDILAVPAVEAAPIPGTVKPAVGGTPERG